MGARGDADRIADVDDQMEAVKKQLEALNQRNTLLSNLKEVKDADLLQIREECDQAETQITDLQKERDSLIKQLGGESTNIKDPNFKFENLKTYKDKANITACKEARTKLHAELTRLKDVVKDLASATENEAKFKSLREAASKKHEALISKLKNPKAYQKLQSDIPRLTNGDVASYNTFLTESYAQLEKQSKELEKALEALSALEVSKSPIREV
jgi:spore germination protein YaaH